MQWSIVCKELYFTCNLFMNKSTSIIGRWTIRPKLLQLLVSRQQQIILSYNTSIIFYVKHTPWQIGWSREIFLTKSDLSCIPILGDEQLERVVTISNHDNHRRTASAVLIIHPVWNPTVCCLLYNGRRPVQSPIVCTIGIVGAGGGGRVHSPT